MQYNLISFVLRISIFCLFVVKREYEENKMKQNEKKRYGRQTVHAYVSLPIHIRYVRQFC